MGIYEKEVEENFKQFDASSFQTLMKIREVLAASSAQYLTSYRRVTSLQAWRSLLLEEVMQPEALAFFLEAPNDALSSHVLARAGVWRSALQALRSCIENVMMSVYYAEHPVELRLWSAGRHRLSFSELMTYFEKHPDLDGAPGKVASLETLRNEYSTLSRAVHASSVGFRMTAAGKPELWSAEGAKLGAWATRERTMMIAVNLFLLAMFKAHLQGTRKGPLREALMSVVPPKRAAEVKKTLKVTIA